MNTINLAIHVYTQHLSEVNLHVDPLDGKPVSGAPAKRHYEEDSSSEEEPARKTKQKVVKISSEADSSEDEDQPLLPSQSKVLRSLIVNDWSF